MKIHAPTPAKAGPTTASSLAGVSLGRRCACGGQLGFEATCTSCRARSLSGGHPLATSTARTLASSVRIAQSLVPLTSRTGRRAPDSEESTTAPAPTSESGKSRSSDKKPESNGQAAQEQRGARLFPPLNWVETTVVAGLRSIKLRRHNPEFGPDTLTIPSVRFTIRASVRLTEPDSVPSDEVRQLRVGFIQNSTHDEVWVTHQDPTDPSRRPTTKVFDQTGRKLDPDPRSTPWYDPPSRLLRNVAQRFHTSDVPNVGDVPWFLPKLGLALVGLKRRFRAEMFVVLAKSAFYHPLKSVVWGFDQIETLALPKNSRGERPPRLENRAIVHHGPHTRNRGRTGPLVTTGERTEQTPDSRANQAPPSNQPTPPPAQRVRGDRPSLLQSDPERRARQEFAKLRPEPDPHAGSMDHQEDRRNRTRANGNAIRPSRSDDSGGYDTLNEQVDKYINGCTGVATPTCKNGRLDAQADHECLQAAPCGIWDRIREHERQHGRDIAKLIGRDPCKLPDGRNVKDGFDIRVLAPELSKRLAWARTEAAAYRGDVKWATAKLKQESRKPCRRALRSFRREAIRGLLLSIIGLPPHV